MVGHIYRPCRSQAAAPTRSVSVSHVLLLVAALLPGGGGADAPENLKIQLSKRGEHARCHYCCLPAELRSLSVCAMPRPHMAKQCAFDQPFGAKKKERKNLGVER